MILTPGLSIDKVELIKPSNKKDTGGQKFWWCSCICGNKVKISGKKLHRAKNITCGKCANSDYGANIKDQVFNYLTAIEKDSKKSAGYWLFNCKCGSVTSQKAHKVKNGLIKSCGCYKREGDNQLIHGSSRKNRQTPLYSMWCRINRRCYDVNSDNYKYYGGRGISVYFKWRNDFKKFRD